MGLEDFSSLIELSAALNVAFIAIEYAKSFTRGVVRRFFKFHSLIEDRAKLCLEKLYDEPTIENIHPVTFEGGKTTEGTLSESKRKYNDLRKKIDDSKKELCNEVDNMCSSKCLPTLCLFLFLYNTSQLFFSAFTSGSQFLEVDCSCFFMCSFLFLTVFTFLFLSSCWFYVEPKEQWIDKYSSLRFVGIVFFICIVISLALGSLYLCKNFIAFVLLIWDVVVVVSVLFTFINLVIVLFLLHRKGEKVKTHIKTKYEKLDVECNDRNNDIKKHMHGEELEANSENEADIPPILCR